LRGHGLSLRWTRARRVHAIGTRCGLTVSCSHDRLRSSFTQARRRQLNRAASPAPTLRPARPRPSPSPPRIFCGSSGPRGPISPASSRPCHGIDSPSSSCRGEAWRRGSAESPKPGARSAPGWPRRASRSCSPSGDDVPRGASKRTVQPTSCSSVTRQAASRASARASWGASSRRTRDGRTPFRHRLSRAADHSCRRAVMGSRRAALHAG
jgi:hypothetical protein